VLYTLEEKTDGQICYNKRLATSKRKRRETVLTPYKIRLDIGTNMGARMHQAAGWTESLYCAW
jgi:hypothetical protein